MTRVLIVENDPSSRHLLSTFFESDRYETIEAASVREAKRALASRQVDVVFAPPEMPDGDLLGALSAARDADPALSVVLFGDAAARASEDLPAGALEIMAKPLRPEPIAAAAARAAERCHLRRENASLKEEVGELRGAVEQATQNGNGHGEDPAGNGNGNGNGHAFEEWISSLPDSFDLRRLEAHVEREIVKRALASSSGVAAQAARKLGLSRSDLAYKLRRLGITRDPR
jgi:DNA-binding NtrC family response regulator